MLISDSTEYGFPSVLVASTRQRCSDQGLILATLEVSWSETQEGCVHVYERNVCLVECLVKLDAVCSACSGCARQSFCGICNSGDAGKVVEIDISPR